MKITIVNCSVPDRLSKLFGSVMLFREDFTECLDAISTFSKMGVMDLGDIIMESNEGYPVYCSDIAVCVSGVPSRIPGAISTADTDGNPIIVVNKRLLEENEWFVEAVLQHETGHIKLHSTMKRTLINNVLHLFSIPKAEYEADEYAMSSSHMLCALKRLQELGVDVRKRIAHLESVLMLAV